MNHPAVRNAELWDLKTPEHGSTLRLPSLYLIVCKGEALFDWRYQNYVIAISDSDTDAIVNAVDSEGGEKVTT